MDDQETATGLASTFWVTWGYSASVIIGAAAIGVALHGVLFAILTRLARQAGREAMAIWAKRLQRPASLILPTLAVQLALPAADLESAAYVFLSHTVSLVMIAAVTWVLIVAINTATERLLLQHRIDLADNLEARKAHTQIRVLGRSVAIIAGVVGAAIALMTFPQVRQIGTSLLASAGLAGLVIGLAARPLVTNLIAGIQIVFTQPIRIDDVVIVEGEWGRVEEFTPTYVVIRIWDERRLIVPLGWFLENSFQNWTRRTSDILGTVMIHADYSTPVDAVRQELTRIVKDDPDWDGRVQLVQVTDATAETMQLRMLLSAESAGKAFDLRCRVREKIIAFLQQRHPESLPRVRAELHEVKQLSRGKPQHQQHGPSDVSGGSGEL